jgi:tartrate dehydrogenase/decarboxylase/D-malate dehydrogenase
MRRYRVAVLPGDGIGPSVIAEGLRTLQLLADLRGDFQLQTEEFPWGCEYYMGHGAMMPGDALETLARFDALYLGAVGYPAVPDHVSLWGMLLPIRQGFDLYVNLRPIRLLPGIAGPLRRAEPQDIDFVCVRENTEGEYAGVGGRVHRGTQDEVALQTAVYTRRGVERIIRYAFELARREGRHRVTSATKSNAQQYGPVLWDEVFADVAAEYPAIVFEPVHGSAPDIADKGIANPIAAIWSGQLMLEYLGEGAAAAALMSAIEAVTSAGRVRTPDLGGSATTAQMGDAIRDALRAQ